MKRRWVDPLIVFVTLIAAVSCATAAISMFSLESLQKSPKEAVIGIVKGTVDYGRGYYLPTENSTLDISLLMVEGDETTELSHQRIRNIQRFPFQFSIRFDESELKNGAYYTVILSFTNDGEEYLQVKTGLTPVYPPDNISLTLN
jgi:uncharacterized lipoprotein YbaY